MRGSAEKVERFVLLLSLFFPVYIVVIELILSFVIC